MLPSLHIGEISFQSRSLWWDYGVTAWCYVPHCL